MSSGLGVPQDPREARLHGSQRWSLQMLPLRPDNSSEKQRPLSGDSRPASSSSKKEKKEASKEEAEEEVEDESKYPGSGKLIMILVALMLVVFLTALDQTIIGTAIPKITDQFGALDDVGWYGSAFTLYVLYRYLVL